MDPQSSPSRNSQQSAQSSPNSKSPTQKKHSDRVVIVQNASQQDFQQSQTIDPLEEEITSMKMTKNLIKEISFNNSINKFDNLQMLLRKEHEAFGKKIESTVNGQKEILRKVKAVRDIASFDPRTIRRIDENKLAKDIRDVADASNEVTKYKKLSFAMIHALTAIEKKLDEKLGLASPIKSSPEKIDSSQVQQGKQGEILGSEIQAKIEQPTQSATENQSAKLPENKQQKNTEEAPKEE